MALNSSDVATGNDATATQYNNLRADVVEHDHDGVDTALVKFNRAFAFGLKGTLATGNSQGMQYIAPQNLTAVKIWYKTTSGTATVRLKRGTTTIGTYAGVGDSVGSSTSFDSSSITAGQTITLDITAISSAVDVFVILECRQN